MVSQCLHDQRPLSVREIENSLAEDLTRLRMRLTEDAGILERTVPLHDLQELNNHLAARADEHLALAALLGVVDGVERIVEDGCLDHVDGGVRFSRRGVCGERYLRVVLMSAVQEPVRAGECPPGIGGFFSSVRRQQCHRRGGR